MAILLKSSTMSALRHHARKGLIGLAFVAPAAHAEVPAVDAGLRLGTPAVLETGLTAGVGAGVSFGDGLVWGAHGSWSTATEYTLTRTVTQDEIRLRLHGGVEGRLGLGLARLQLGVGGTAVREVATRNQGARAGLSGSALEQIAWRLVPGGELEAEVGVHVWEALAVVVQGGPALHVLDGTHWGFVGGLALAWRP